MENTMKKIGSLLIVLITAAAGFWLGGFCRAHLPVRSIQPVWRHVLKFTVCIANTAINRSLPQIWSPYR